MGTKIVIVGGVAGGATCAARLRRLGVGLLIGLIGGYLIGRKKK